MIIVGLEEWGLVLRRGMILDPKIIYVGVWNMQAWHSCHHWSLGLGPKRYERTPTQTVSRGYQGPRSWKVLSMFSGPSNSEWLESWLYSHVNHVHPRCIPNIRFFGFQRNTSPCCHITCAFVGCPIPTEYVPNLPPKFCWRWGCHPNIQQ